MAVDAKHQDQPSRDGSVNEPTAAQLDAATADGSPIKEPAELSDLEAERDRNLRLRAELENYRARAARELATERRYAAMPLVRDLLPVIDNVDRAIDAAQQKGETGPLVEGFRMVRQQLAGILEQHQCQPISAVGEAFDPQRHEAILQQPSAQVPAGHVTAATQVGYQLHDRVVRPAQVIVSSGPA